MKRGLVVFYVLLPSLLWGSVFPFTKMALIEVSPADIAFYRTLLGLISLLAIFRSINNFIIRRSDLIPLTILSLCGISLFRILLNLGIDFSESSKVSFLSATYPSLSAILAYFILHERLGGKKIVSVIMGLIGSYIIIVGGGFEPVSGFQEVMGGAMALLASLTWAFYIVLARRFYLRSSPQSDYVTASMFLLSLPPLTIISLSLSGPANPLELSMPSNLSLLWLGLVASAIPYFLFNKALKVLPASTAGLSLALTPLIGSLLSALLLGEKIGLATALGGGLIVLGTALVHTRPLRLEAPREEAAPP